VKLLGRLCILEGALVVGAIYTGMSIFTVLSVVVGVVIVIVLLMLALLASRWWE
jgi:hypothetical protein